MTFYLKVKTPLVKKLFPISQKIIRNFQVYPTHITDLFILTIYKEDKDGSSKDKYEGVKSIRGFGSGEIGMEKQN